MRKSFLDNALRLQNENKAYATAYIVRRKTPSSGKPGDKAIITEAGEILGWIGGGCTRGIVLKEALSSLKDRKPRYVKISPDQQKLENDNVKVYNMTCQSGGEVEVYIEPVLPKPKIVVFGTSHIAMALVKLGVAMDYQIQVVMSSVDPAVFPTASDIVALSDFDGENLTDAYVIVCTQGEGDADALHKALSTESGYLSFVASRKKANSIFNELREKGASFDQLKLIKTPAGLDIGAKLPEEVAISILAEIIQDFRTISESSAGDAQAVEITNEDYYMNPVCNIPIQKSTAKHVLDYNGESVYFCCDGCKVSFEKDPDKYMIAQ